MNTQQKSSEETEKAMKAKVESSLLIAREVHKKLEDAKMSEEQLLKEVKEREEKLKSFFCRSYHMFKYKKALLRLDAELEAENEALKDANVKWEQYVEGVRDLKVWGLKNKVQ